MPDLSPLAIVGFGAVALLIVCWLATAFTAPGRARDRVAWVGATAMYVAFGCLFLSLFLRARAGDSWAGMLGFGFLLFFFTVGFALAVQRLVRVFAGRGGGKVESATH